MSMKSSYYQSRYRARLREKGYVKREIWIPPEYSKILKDCETALRVGVLPIVPKTALESEMSEDGIWTTDTLHRALAQSEAAGEGALTVELVAGIDPAILITMAEFGDLPLLMSVSGRQILVETLLWPVDEGKDTAAFSEQCFDGKLQLWEHVGHVLQAMQGAAEVLELDGRMAK